MIITRKIEFDMGHRIPNHGSKCKNPHGHRYVLEVGVDDKLVTISGAENEGMVMDFSMLKYHMMKQIDNSCDHGFMISREDIDLINAFYDGTIATLDLIDEEIKMFGYANAFGAQKNADMTWRIIIVPFVPTAENIAKWIYDKLQPKLLDDGIKIAYVKLWETPNCSALYTGEPQPQGVRLG